MNNGGLSRQMGGSIFGKSREIGIVTFELCIFD